jgi:hypothetical protein
MLLKSYHHLHHVTDCEIGFANQKVDEDFSLDIFEMIISINELAKELLIFKRFQMNVKKIKCPFKWWPKHDFIFPTIGFLAW